LTINFCETTFVKFVCVECLRCYTQQLRVCFYFIFKEKPCVLTAETCIFKATICYRNSSIQQILLSLQYVFYPMFIQYRFSISLLLCGIHYGSAS